MSDPPPQSRSEPATDGTLLASLRERDHDRFLTVLMAPAGQREKLAALYLFNAEIARVREAVSEPMLGEIRLQWWRETVEEIFSGRAPRGHEAAIAMARAFGGESWAAEPLIALIDARSRDLDDRAFESLGAMEAYARETGGALMHLAAGLLLGEPAPAEPFTAAGTAYALTGMLRAIPYYSAIGRIALPTDHLESAGVSEADLLQHHEGGRLGPVIAAVAERARALLEEAGRAPAPPKATRPALYPAALVLPYLKRLTRPDFDPFRDASDIPAFRRQLRLLRTSWGRGF